ncbi:hypothetical protein D3C81_2194500 [compost metagenome]
MRLRFALQKPVGRNNTGAVISEIENAIGFFVKVWNRAGGTRGRFGVGRNQLLPILDI